MVRFSFGYSELDHDNKGLKFANLNFTVQIRFFPFYGRCTRSSGTGNQLLSTYPMSQKLKGTPRPPFGNGCVRLDDNAEVKYFFSF